MTKALNKLSIVVKNYFLKNKPNNRITYRTILATNKVLNGSPVTFSSLLGSPIMVFMQT